MTEVECQEDANCARFSVYPLDRGWGITLGNCLRRVLLSSLPGTAVTWVRIEGIEHEFSPLPHVVEDVVDFLLNVKAVRIRPLVASPEGKLVLEAEGEGEVLAGAINCPAEFDIANPEFHLATLDDPEARLYVELNVESGVGFKEAGDKDGLPLGAIPIDAVLTPVRKISYDTEELPSGEEKLILEVWTDGTISGREAVRRAALIIQNKLSLFSERGTPAASTTDSSLAELGLSSHTLNVLRRGRISTLGDLVSHSKKELMLLRSFGPKSLEEVEEKLGEKGLSFSEDETPEEE